MPGFRTSVFQAGFGAWLDWLFQICITLKTPKFFQQIFMQQFPRGINIFVSASLQQLTCLNILVYTGVGEMDDPLITAIQPP